MSEIIGSFSQAVIIIVVTPLLWIGEALVGYLFFLLMKKIYRNT